MRKEVQRRDSCEAWQRAKLVNSDWEGRDESMKGSSLRHEKLPTTRRSSTELVDDNLCDLSLATHFWDLAHRPGKPRMRRRRRLGRRPVTSTSNCSSHCGGCYQGSRWIIIDARRGYLVGTILTTLWSHVAMGWLNASYRW